MPVYLLHSTIPLVRANGKEVRHYLGYVENGNVYRRLDEHRKGRHSAAVVRAMRDAGGLLELGNYWPEGTRDDERRMKRNGHLENKCLVCAVETAIRALAEMKP